MKHGFPQVEGVRSDNIRYYQFASGKKPRCYH